MWWVSTHICKLRDNPVALLLVERCINLMDFVKGGLIPYLCVVDVAEKGRSPVVQEHRIVVTYGHPLKLALVSCVCLILTTRADRC